MKAYRTSVYLAAFLGLVLLVLFGCEDAARKSVRPDATVKIQPEGTDDVLSNPGMGWQTFHHTADDDENLPEWIPSTVHYARWGWDTLEPEPGKINYAFLDEVLGQTRQAGQRLAFRAMCCSTRPDHPYHPDWLEGVGGKILACDYAGTEGLLVPDLDDPVVLERHLDFIRRLGERYDGHPDIDHVDIGTVGWWGEWHMSSSKAGKMPMMANRKKIIDAYTAAFRKTPLLMLIGGGECLTYAIRKGAGWRADCLGDMGGFSKTWCHMCDAYPKLIPAAGVQDAWKTAPIAWESCWDMRRWVKEDWSLRYIFNYALALHGSYLNNKSAPLPAGENVRAEIERFLRRFGYRLVLKEIEHPKRIRAGELLTLPMKWQNTGSAPCYRPYRVAYRLTGKDGRELTFVGNIAVDKWMPGSVETFTEEFMKEPPDPVPGAVQGDLPPGQIVNVIDHIFLPDDISAGPYLFDIAVVGSHRVEGVPPSNRGQDARDTLKPVVKLGIKGRMSDGWYPLSEIEIITEEQLK